MKLLINILVVVLIMFLMYYYFTPSDEEANCKIYKEYKELTINGLVVNKCYDSKQHSYPAIDVKSFHDLSVQRIYLIGEKFKLFNFLNLYDTIVKETNCDTISVKRNGIIKQITLDFGCKEQLSR